MYLNCHSYFSFKYGILSPEQLLQEAQQKGISTLALTDINNTSGILDFFRLAPRYKIKPVAGIDFRNGTEQKFIGIARTADGFRELNDFLSWHLHNKEPIPDKAPVFKYAFIIYPKKAAEKRIKRLRENEYIGLTVREIMSLHVTELKNQLQKLVMLYPVTFGQPHDFNTHKLLRAIDLNTIGTKVPPNEFAQPDEIMLHQYEVIKKYGDYPQIIDNTLKILDACSIDFQFGKNKNKKTYTGNTYEDELLLLKLCNENLKYRYPDADDEIITRYKKEIKVITELGFSSYFLTNWDIVRFARHRNFFYVGRGSGANSMVAYLLRITDVDPIALDLYFERFINAYRTSPPDFDLDFSWTDRDEVIDYIFRKHGNTHTAQLATYSTFKEASILRELGKVFGLPKAEIDSLAEEKKHPDTNDKVYNTIIKYGERIFHFPNHLSIHAGGILISDLPMHYYTATVIPPKGFPLTQFSMLEAEDVGLYKYDILSQRGLGHIKEAIENVKRNKD
jgi:DNA polymerase III alpha subunit